MWVEARSFVQRAYIGQGSWATVGFLIKNLTKPEELAEESGHGGEKELESSNGGLVGKQKVLQSFKENDKKV